MSERFVARCPVAAVWLHILTGILSTLGRLECLASCRDHHTRRYHHRALVSCLGEEEAHSTIGLAHELVWKDWLKGSPEEHHADLLLYLRGPSSGNQNTLFTWQALRALQAWAPDSADLLQRARFETNLGILLDLLRSEQDQPQAGVHSKQAGEADRVIDEVLRFVNENYFRSDLTLSLLAEK